MALGLSTMPYDQGDFGAVGFKYILNWVAIFPNEALLNSPPLLDTATPGAPNIAIQCLIKTSTISSWRLELTIAAAQNLRALSKICKNEMSLMHFKPTERTLNSLDHENTTTVKPV